MEYLYSDEQIAAVIDWLEASKKFSEQSKEFHQKFDMLATERYSLQRDHKIKAMKRLYSERSKIIRFERGKYLRIREESLSSNTPLHDPSNRKELEGVLERQRLLSDPSMLKLLKDRQELEETRTWLNNEAEKDEEIRNYIEQYRSLGWTEIMIKEKIEMIQTFNAKEDNSNDIQDANSSI